MHTTLSQSRLLLLLSVLAGLSACAKTPPEHQSSRSLAELDQAVKKLEQVEKSQGRWVLWRSVTSLDQMQAFIPYFAEDAYRDKTSCLAGAELAASNAVAPGVVLIDITSYQVTNADGRRQVNTFTCLPDTIDPRSK